MLKANSCVHLPRNIEIRSFLLGVRRGVVISSLFSRGKNVEVNSCEYGGSMMLNTCGDKENSVSSKKMLAVTSDMKCLRRE